MNPECHNYLRQKGLCDSYNSWPRIKDIKCHWKTLLSEGFRGKISSLEVTEVFVEVCYGFESLV